MDGGNERDILTNNEIDYIIKEVFNLNGKYRGIFSWNQGKLDTLNEGEGDQIWVFLLQNSPHSTGHWVMVFKNPRGHWQYFDSFGSLPPKQFFRMFQGLEMTNKVYQKERADDCGLFVLKKIQKSFSKREPKN